MGLAADPNLAVRGRIKIDLPSSVSYAVYFLHVNYSFIPYKKSLNKELLFQSENEPKTSVAKLLEKQAKAPRAKDFKFPTALALRFTTLIKKYGEDYKVSDFSFLYIFAVAMTDLNFIPSCIKLAMKIVNAA